MSTVRDGGGGRKLGQWATTSLDAMPINLRAQYYFVHKEISYIFLTSAMGLKIAPGLVRSTSKMAAHKIATEHLKNDCSYRHSAWRSRSIWSWEAQPSIHSKDLTHFPPSHLLCLPQCYAVRMRVCTLAVQKASGTHSITKKQWVASEACFKVCNEEGSLLCFPMYKCE